MKKLILLFLFFIFSTAEVFGQTYVPETSNNAIIHFKSLQIINTSDLTIPEVLEFETLNSSPQNYLLIEQNSNTPQPLAIVVDKKEVNYSVISDQQISNENQALSDNNFSSQVEYPVSNDINTVRLIITYDQSVTSNTFQFDLALNATLPETISISAASPIQKVVVAQRPISSSIVTFPNTTASRWIVTLTYNQPLVLSKVAFVQDPTYLNSVNLIRFLARPGNSYILYSNPEGNFNRPYTSESGNLRGNDVKVRKITAPLVRSNAQFKEPDSDGDGIPDKADNCPNISNQDQLDKDQNNTGDACEDFDSDGIMNSSDNCPDHPNSSQQDTDGDGEGDHCDKEESRLTEQLSFLPWLSIIIAFGVIVGLFIKTARNKPSNPHNSELETAPTLDIKNPDKNKGST